MKKVKKVCIVCVISILIMLLNTGILTANSVDVYSGSYSIEDIISKYNIVAFDNIGTMTHIVGPVLVNGTFGKEGVNIYHSQNTAGVSSFIKGKILSDGNAIQNGEENENPNFYVGTVNTVKYQQYWPENKKIEIGEGEHVVADQYYINDFPGAYSKYMTIRTNNYIDFSKLKSKITSQQATLDEGTVVTKDENGEIHIKGGTISTIESLEGVNKVIFDDFDVFQDATTVIHIKQSGVVNMPILINGKTGNEFTTKDFEKEDGEYKSINLVWNIPNATTLNLKKSPFIGHLIAQNADAKLPQMNFAGCFIVNSLEGEVGTEAHYYPYSGNKLKLKSNDSKEDDPKEDDPKEDDSKEDDPKEDDSKEDDSKEDDPNEDDPKEDDTKGDDLKSNASKDDGQKLEDKNSDNNKDFALGDNELENNNNQNDINKQNESENRTYSVKTGDKVNMYFYAIISCASIYLICIRKKSEVKYKAKHRK